MKLAVLSARRSGKRIPRKNIRPPAKEPGLACGIDVAKDSRCFHIGVHFSALFPQSLTAALASAVRGKK